MFFIIIATVRKVFLVTAMIAALALYMILLNSKEKHEYTVTKGEIQYLSKTYNQLPNRHQGKYRYLIVDGYKYPFEIYKPNSIETNYDIDDLKVGDVIEAYYYEINQTHEIGLNRFLQYIDKDNIPHFERNSFQRNLGYIILSLIHISEPTRPY